MSSPPSIPERHPHRNTYPAATSGQSSVHARASVTTTVESAGQNRVARRRRTQQSVEHIENDVEAHLDGLEEDRRTWLARREDGNLDVTPPREGRFERYLS